MIRKENNLQLALDGLMKLTENEILRQELALEAFEFLKSFFNSGLNHTVRIEKEGKRSLFYSTLTEDEAHFWDWPLSHIHGLQRPGNIGCRRVELPLVSGFYGVWILEDKKRDIPEFTKEESDLIRLVYLFSVTCLLSKEAESNLETDPVTGFPGVNVFVREIERQIEEKLEYFLIAVRIPIVSDISPPCGERMDEGLIYLSDICRKICLDRVFRIAADILAFTTEGSRELAYGRMQEILECVPEAAVFLTPLSHLKNGKMLTRIQKELGNTEKGKASVEGTPTFPRLPIFTGQTEMEQDKEGI